MIYLKHVSSVLPLSASPLHAPPHGPFATPGFFFRVVRGLSTYTVGAGFSLQPVFFVVPTGAHFAAAPAPTAGELSGSQPPPFSTTASDRSQNPHSPTAPPVPGSESSETASRGEDAGALPHKRRRGGIRTEFTPAELALLASNSSLDGLPTDTLSHEERMALRRTRKRLQNRLNARSYRARQIARLSVSRSPSSALPATPPAPAFPTHAGLSIPSRLGQVVTRRPCSEERATEFARRREEANREGGPDKQQRK